VNGFEVLLLTTRGRRTGEPRDAALQYLTDGDAFVVIGSRAGDARHPAWWLNLAARPEAEVLASGTRRRVHAREATGAERARLWSRFTAIDPAYDEYERRTTRRIPVVVLEPSDGARA
jgi:deazaflavin-dependent oxidoreductase (nitroreductase family)